MFCLCFLLLSFIVRCEATIPKILFTVQSQGVTFTQWIEFFTLCLAPLIAHVLGGVVSPTLLGSGCPPPSWTARLPHLNPISVIWRYYAIAGRRLRARTWDRADMAACNAVFWDGERKRYDGSEEIMVKSRAWITQLPEKRHVEPFSSSTVTSFVLAWQGVYATFTIIDGLLPDSPYRIQTTLVTVFGPLACLGLMRLPAAIWLSNDHGYLSSWSNTVTPGMKMDPLEKTASDNVLEAHSSNQSSDESIGNRLRPAHCWQGVVYRVFWLLSVWCILGAAATNCSRIWWAYAPGLPYRSVLSLIFDAMYLVLTVATILMHTTYVVLGKTTSTIIPCVHATWYKVFTLLWILTAFVCVVLSALQTRVRSNGTVTSFPEFQCGKPGALCYPVSVGHGNTNI